MATIPIVNDKDKRNGIIISAIVSSIVLVFLWLVVFQFPDPPVQDIPLKTETLLEEIELKDLVVEGGAGGGEPIDAPEDKPKPQTEKVITKQENQETKVPTGESNHTTGVNQTNKPSTPKPSEDPFASGGADGGSGGGTGGTFGSDSGTSGSGPGGNGGSGKGRVRLNNVNVSGLTINVDATIYFKVTVDAQGNVVNVQNIKAKTTTSNQVLINQIAMAVKKQVKYNKDPGSPLVAQHYTVHIKAQ